MNSFLIANPDKCIGCRTCEIACVVAHSETNIFHEEGKIDFNPKLSVIKTKEVSAPIQCRHCEDAPCVKVCPYNAIKKVDGSIKIDEKACIGCKTCAIACPIGAIEMTNITIQEELANMDGKFHFKEKMIANKCDFCVGREGGPACAEICPTKAFVIVKKDELDKSIKNKRKANLNSLKGTTSL